MKILIQIILLCSLAIGSAYAENTPPAPDTKTTAKSEALDKDSVCTRDRKSTRLNSSHRV